ncbi:MAG: EAL domain-containing protein [Thermaerobacter sp.]|nr:EAL domain-containing protein [Thermaerobacter sp.]
MFFLDALWTALQPIINLETGEIIGHEALIRGPEGTSWALPQKIIGSAARVHRERELEMRCRHLAFSAGRERLPRGQTLFLNVDLQHLDLPLVPDSAPKPPGQVAIEISEQHEIIRNVRALETLHVWRSEGHLIVQDDFGVGYASLGSILAIKPDMIKVDKFLVTDIDQDRDRRAAISTVVKLARDLGAAVVAEGVETIGELRALQDCGIQYAQGYLLGRPERQAKTGTVTVVGQRTNRPPED